jgi:hypothetical protein
VAPNCKSVEVLEHDLQQLDSICQEVIASDYQQVEILDASAADKLIRDIEQRLRLTAG